MEYTQLTVDQQREQLRGRLLQYEADHARAATDIAVATAVHKTKGSSKETKQAAEANVEAMTTIQGQARSCARRRVSGTRCARQISREFRGGL